MFDEHLNEKVILEGVVVGDPDVREKIQQFVVRTEYGDVLVSTEPYRTRIQYDDRVKIEGKIKTPEPFISEASTTVDYASILAAKNIFYIMSFAKISVLEHSDGQNLFSLLYNIKAELVRSAEGLLPKTEAGFLSGMLVGSARGMGKEVTDAFRRVGLIHIVVLSGYNIALVIRAAEYLLAYVLPRTAAFVGAGLFAVLFMLMSGATATALRATGMALVVLLSQWLRRPADALRILLIVAAAMALYNPRVVLFDVSYQLSVMATLGLVTLSGWLKERLSYLPTTFGIQEIVASTIAVELFVSPILLYTFGQFSLLGVIANALVLPVLPYTMLAGFVAVIIGLFSHTLAMPAALFAYIGLRYSVVIAMLMSYIPFASIQL